MKLILSQMLINYHQTLEFTCSPKIILILKVAKMQSNMEMLTTFQTDSKLSLWKKVHISQISCFQIRPHMFWIVENRKSMLVTILKNLISSWNVLKCEALIQKMRSLEKKEVTKKWVNSVGLDLWLNVLWWGKWTNAVTCMMITPILD